MVEGLVGVLGTDQKERWRHAAKYTHKQVRFFFSKEAGRAAAHLRYVVCRWLFGQSEILKIKSKSISYLDSSIYSY